MEPPCGTLLDGGLVHQHPKDKPNPNTQTPYPITEASYSEALARLYTQSHHHKNLMQTQKQITNHPFIPTTRNTTHNGAKALIFNSNEYYGQIAAKCKFTLVGKSSKPMPKLVEIVAKFLEKISTKGEVELVARTNRIIFINCSNEDDCKSIYFRRVIDFSDDVQMWLQRWNPDFEPDHDMPFAPIWVQLPDLPYHLHDWECLKKIGSLLGEPLTMDAATKSRNRPSLAKIRVDVDLTKPLPRQIWIGHEEEGAPLKGFFQKIEYDFVPKYCTHCKRLGHSNSICRNLGVAKNQEAPKHTSGNQAAGKKVFSQSIENQKENVEMELTVEPSRPLEVQKENQRKGKQVAIEPQKVIMEKGEGSKRLFKLNFFGKNRKRKEIWRIKADHRVFKQKNLPEFPTPHLIQTIPKNQQPTQTTTPNNLEVQKSPVISTDEQRGGGADEEAHSQVAPKLPSVVNADRDVNADGGLPQQLNEEQASSVNHGACHLNEEASIPSWSVEEQDSKTQESEERQSDDNIDLSLQSDGAFGGVSSEGAMLNHIKDQESNHEMQAGQNSDRLEIKLPHLVNSLKRPNATGLQSPEATTLVSRRNNDLTIFQPLEDNYSKGPREKPKFDYPPSDPMVKRAWKDWSGLRKAKAKCQRKEEKKSKKEEQKRMEKEERRKAREDRKREREAKRMARDNPQEVNPNDAPNLEEGEWQKVPPPKWKQRMEKSKAERAEIQTLSSPPMTRSRAKLDTQTQSQK